MNAGRFNHAPSSGCSPYERVMQRLTKHQGRPVCVKPHPGKGFSKPDNQGAYLLKLGKSGDILEVFNTGPHQGTRRYNTSNRPIIRFVKFLLSPGGRIQMLQEPGYSDVNRPIDISPAEYNAHRQLLTRLDPSKAKSSHT